MELCLLPHPQVEVKEMGVAVARFRPGTLEHVQRANHSYRFTGEPLSVHQAYLVWIPFSLPENTVSYHSCSWGCRSHDYHMTLQAKKEESDDTISSSRFEDNEVSVLYILLPLLLPDTHCNRSCDIPYVRWS